jgi:hypothetical protein
MPRSRAEAVSASRDSLLGLAHPLWSAKEMRARHLFHVIAPNVGFPDSVNADQGYLVAAA